MAYGSLAFGLLTGTFTEDMDFGSQDWRARQGKMGSIKLFDSLFGAESFPQQRPRRGRAEGHRGQVRPEPAAARAALGDLAPGDQHRARRLPDRRRGGGQRRRDRLDDRGRGPRRDGRDLRAGTGSRPSRTTGSRNDVEPELGRARSRSSPAAPAVSAGRPSELFVAEGARVVIADTDVERGEALAAELGDAVAFKPTDVAEPDEVQALVDFAVAHFGGLHIMFNNAGHLRLRRAASSPTTSRTSTG